MTNSTTFQHLQFTRAIWRFSVRLGVVLVATVFFCLVWIFVPAGVRFWLLLPAQALLVWLASHGWRRALLSVHQLVHLIENFDGGWR